MKRKPRKPAQESKSVKQARADAETTEAIADTAKKVVRQAKSKLKSAKKTLKQAERAAKRARKDARRAAKALAELIARQRAAKKRTSPKRAKRRPAAGTSDASIPTQPPKSSPDVFDETISPRPPTLDLPPM